MYPGIHHLGYEGCTQAIYTTRVYKEVTQAIYTTRVYKEGYPGVYTTLCTTRGIPWCTYHSIPPWVYLRPYLPPLMYVGAASGVR